MKKINTVLNWQLNSSRNLVDIMLLKSYFPRNHCNIYVLRYGIYAITVKCEEETQGPTYKQSLWELYNISLFVSYIPHTYLSVIGQF